MHPRNPYKNSPDFSSLAEFFPPLKPYLLPLSSGHTIDFRNPNAQRVLTQALLKRDFDITLSLSEHRLCPPVPNRLNYVLWVQDILFPYDGIIPGINVRGLDVGTGASAIYPLLACSLPHAGNWSFVGTEIDPLSASLASQNVEANNLQSRITIWPVQKISNSDLPIFEECTQPTPILAPLLAESDFRFDFTMCNPPFYGSKLEIEDSEEAKELPPVAVCTGAETEMITPGGETAFVRQMLHESAREDIRGRCRWFTSMLGKLGSVGEIVGELRRLKIDNYALAQFIQGTTRRWAVAWSFGDERLPDTVTRPSSSSLSPYLPTPTTLRKTFTIVHKTNASSLSEASAPLKAALSHVLNSLSGIIHQIIQQESKGQPDGRLWRFDITANENTWSRAARRKQKPSTSSSSDNRIDENPRNTATPLQPPAPLRYEKTPPAPVFSHGPALHCWLCVLAGRAGSISRASRASLEVTLEAQWVNGRDRTMFEGFWSHVCRKVGERLDTS